MRWLDEPLERGDSYTVRAYVPDPTRARDARGAAPTYDLDLLQYTRVALPLAGETALDQRPRQRRTRRPPRA